MPQTSEVTSDPSEQEDDYKPFSRWWAVPGLALAMGVAALVSQFGSFAMGEAAGICTVPTIAVLCSCWRHYRHERWAILFAGTVVLLHVVAIALIPWPARHEFSKGDLLFVWADLFANYGLMALFRLASDRTHLRLLED